MTDNTLLTEDEVMRLLRTSRTTIWKLRKTGRIAYRRINGSVRYTRRDVAEYLTSVKRPALESA